LMNLCLASTTGSLGLAASQQPGRNDDQCK
jgi:hypothetical protein